MTSKQKTGIQQEIFYPNEQSNYLSSPNPFLQQFKSPFTSVYFFLNPIQGRVWNYVMGQGWANFAQIFYGQHKFSK